MDNSWIRILVNIEEAKDVTKDMLETMADTLDKKYLRPMLRRKLYNLDIGEDWFVGWVTAKNVDSVKKVVEKWKYKWCKVYVDDMDSPEGRLCGWNGCVCDDCRYALPGG